MGTDVSEASDAELVARVRSRDRAALEVLYDRYARSVYSLALSILHDPGAAEEVTQELFLHVWQYPQLYDAARGPFGPWLLRSARNRAIDVLRRRTRERQLSWRLEMTTHVSDQNDPDDTALQNEAVARVRQALAELDSGLRQVIELAYFGGLTQREIAERLGVPLGTVKTRVRTALQRLAAALAGDREPWTDTR
ncbi:ECF RNA polymerase sigma factor SigK [bacterium HR28]|jgi:RNA polymerase sigma-70 factor (ECF subfamily)|uniref:Sigma-70 family RNA polymerase sigma factor n=1 Tax=Thermomicrobium roseum TaxID=500 RepID=A0A7C2B1X3_THERO|nr:ECF RNA polymerase sigma factor SigK [bacterium HR28]